MPTRHWTVAVAHLGGYDDVTIARSLGYATSSVVERVLCHPAVRALIENIQQAQLARPNAGWFSSSALVQTLTPTAWSHSTSST